MIEETLRELGFNEKEIVVYLELLKLGTSTVTIIGKRIGVARNNVQYTCQQLLKKGVVSMVEKNNTFYFSAESPQKLLQNLELQKKALDQKVDKVGRIVNELEALRNPASAMPKVKFFEGKDGYIDFCEESLRCKNKEIWFATNMDSFCDIVTTEYDEKTYIPTRLKEGIFLRLLTVRSPLTKKMHKADEGEQRETRFLPKEFFINNTMFLFDDTVTLITNESYPSCVMITSEELANTMRTFYEFMWQNAEGK